MVKCNRSFRSLNSTGNSETVGDGGRDDSESSEPEEDLVLESCEDIRKQQSDQFQYR